MALTHKQEKPEGPANQIDRTGRIFDISDETTKRFLIAIAVAATCVVALIVMFKL